MTFTQGVIMHVINNHEHNQYQLGCLVSKAKWTGYVDIYNYAKGELVGAVSIFTVLYYQYG